MAALRRITIRLSMIVLVLAVLSLGCASIMGGGSSQKVPITSVPQATFVVKQGATGMKVVEGSTPATITLSRRNEYLVELTVAGYQPQTVAITKETNSWVWGNLICGGIIGIIIDYSSGAAYKLQPDEISITMLKASIEGEDGLYAVFCRMDENGELRHMMVPLIALNGKV